MIYKIFLFLLIVVLVHIYLCKNRTVNKTELEHMSNDEAIQNLAGLYNTGNMKVGNFETTGTAKVGTNLNIGGSIGVQAGATISGPLNANGGIVTNAVNVNGIVNATNGYFSGGSGGPGGGTHFPWAANGENYIRGHTNHDGSLRINHGQLCLGGVCIDAHHLRLLRDGFKIQTLDGGHHRGGWIHTHENGNMAVADPKYRTIYKMHTVET
jgi:hypothetical protein